MDALKNRHILIVDDEEADRMLLASYLQRQGCQTSYAVDGIDGIEKARVLQPDLILMDSEMPRCNGRDACKVLTTDPSTKAIPIVFISGMTASEQRVRGLLAGAVDYINKPFEFDEVKLRLVIHLKNRAPVIASSLMSADTFTPPESKHDILFHRARGYLLASLHCTLPMAELEALTCSNSKLLNRAFKMCAGVTVYEYLREERMKEARTLLQKTQLAVQDIAYEIGFTDSANFSTAFKEKFGLSPREFRQLNH